jgi:DNA polymerase (family 10)
MPEVVHVYARGSTKTLVRLANGLDADLRVVPAKSFGAALLYFTGSKDHSVKLRRIAIEKKLKLNEYGLFRGSRSTAAATEEEIYDALGLEYVPPELREDHGEIEAARTGSLPDLIEYGDLRGDLQIQTKRTDGANSIVEMAEAARRVGYDYIAITDHTRDLAMARGCTEDDLRKQAREIRRLNAAGSAGKGFRILSGAEVNIRQDGTLDVADEALAELDVVGAGIHSFFHMGREENTRRILRAIENPHVDILFHPTSRSIGKREPLDIDFDEVVAAAGRTGTILEIDALPDRLDLNDDHVRKAVEAGVLLAIDSDAHQASHLSYADELGVAVARRGWAKRSDVVNTRSVGGLLGCLKGARSRSRVRRS